MKIRFREHEGDFWREREIEIQEEEIAKILDDIVRIKLKEERKFWEKYNQEPIEDRFFI